MEASLARVKAEIQGGKIDPIATLERVETAHQSLDAALSGIRDQQEQARRAQASLQQSIMSAQAQISATSDYITARRGGVGTEARTRLAEAQRNLDYALSISRTDPVTALQYAQQAHALAAQAAQLAQSDVDHFGGYANQGYGRGGMFGGGGGGGLGGAILGGILINSILHGGGGGGGWGGGGRFRRRLGRRRLTPAAAGAGTSAAAATSSQAAARHAGQAHYRLGAGGNAPAGG